MGVNVSDPEERKHQQGCYATCPTSCESERSALVPPRFVQQRMSAIAKGCCVRSRRANQRSVASRTGGWMIASRSRRAAGPAKTMAASAWAGSAACMAKAPPGSNCGAAAFEPDEEAERDGDVQGDVQIVDVYQPIGSLPLKCQQP